MSKKVDYSDDVVLKVEMAEALNLASEGSYLLEPEDIAVGYWQLVPGRDFLVKFVNIKNTEEEYGVFQDLDHAKKVAILYEKWKIETILPYDEFTNEFIIKYINKDKLLIWVEKYILDELENIAKYHENELYDRAADAGFDIPSEEDLNEMSSAKQTKIKKEFVKKLKDISMVQYANNPMIFLNEFFLSEEIAIEKAIAIAGINSLAAAIAFVDENGWYNSLSNYDGRYEISPKGLIYIILHLDPRKHRPPNWMLPF